MINYLFMRNSKTSQKRVFFANPESIRNKGGRIIAISQKLLDENGKATGKYYCYEALKPYKDRIAFVYYFNDFYTAIDSRNPVFNHNNNDTFICVEGNTDTLNAVTYGFTECYGVLRRFNLTTLPDIPENAKRIVFVRDSNESLEDLIERIIKKYDYEIFNNVAIYTFGMELTGFSDFSDWTDNSEIESNEELIWFLFNNCTHLNSKLKEAGKSIGVA